VIAELEDLFARHGKPRLLRSDQRPRLAGQQVGQAFIERGSPQRNAYVERFNGTMRGSSQIGTRLAHRMPLRGASWRDAFSTARIAS
jgi:transposase InsO family protein